MAKSNPSIKSGRPKASFGSPRWRSAPFQTLDGKSQTAGSLMTNYFDSPFKGKLLSEQVKNQYQSWAVQLLLWLLSWALIR